MPNDEHVDDRLAKSVAGALDSFDVINEETDRRVSMSYSEQCARAIVQSLGRNSEVGRDILAAVRDAKGWSMGIIHELFPGLPTRMVSSAESLKAKLRALDACKMGSKAPIVSMYYDERSRLEYCPQSTAIFMRTLDWGNVVVHGLVWAGDDTLRASIPRILIPGRGPAGDILVIEARKTFIKFVQRLAFED